MINWVLEKYQEEHEPGPGKQPDPEALVAKFTLIRDHEIIEGHKFPLLDRLWDIARGRDNKLSLDLEENYGTFVESCQGIPFLIKALYGVVQGGLREGLRPEFALFCGLHPSEESYYKETYRE
ncbi:hypothetical protein SAMD00023353_5000140 [Rosellinia necatrix]|uniref:Uncharacterized protein n=1 Tax=Rosellinia necatrix TaxID=77044 RepID=A0A1W2TQ33_ROSNE|nr:hypothetical protein SAMD00023353_5000140 [Rosellinia necatrix]